jgi:DNA modification methylase
MTYDQFIDRKTKKPREHGFEPVLPLNPKLFDWQQLIVRWAVRQGRCALFEECGLGKTFQQLEWARQVVAKTGGSVLILAPLGVAKQTEAEGNHWGIDVRRVMNGDEVGDTGIFVTNYERLHLFDTDSFVGVVLDESSILKDFMGKTRRHITESFSQTPYRLCCTATPAPNDYTEIGTQAEMLGVCSYADMLATWFVNDASDTGTWRLKGHAVEHFWRWVATWAICLGTPSDIGFSDDGYILPALNVQRMMVRVDQIAGRGEELFRMVGMSATNIHKEMRRTCVDRVSRTAELINGSKEAWVIWCNTNYEADELMRAIDDAVEVRGCDTPEEKESTLDAFTKGSVKRIITKPSIAGHGLNWQHCSNCVYVGLSYSFEEFYQSIKRLHRYGQTKPVNAYIVQADTETDIYSSVTEKGKRHQAMRMFMKFSAEALQTNTHHMIMKKDTQKECGHNWTLYNGDCVRVLQGVEDQSVDFSVFSPPFVDLFVYSSDVQDMGNAATMEDFMEQFRYMVDNLYRVTKPGRLCAVHCQDVMATKWKDGEIELKNFSGEIINAFREHEWLYHCRVTIYKDPVVEMQRTKAIGLLYKQLQKDSAKSRMGSPDYILIFRKRGDNPNPITHDPQTYPLDQWQKDASPVWLDVDQGNVLNGKLAREDRDERHICPLQLDVINRLLRLYTNKGDLVLSPFAGVGSEGVCALKMRRRFIGAELKPSYWKLACDYLRRAEAEAGDLFEL